MGEMSELFLTEEEKTDSSTLCLPNFKFFEGMDFTVTGKTAESPETMKALKSFRKRRK